MVEIVTMLIGKTPMETMVRLFVLVVVIGILGKLVDVVRGV